MEITASRRRVRRFFLASLLLAAYFSLVRLAVVESPDFQWSPAVLFRDGIDPYAYFMAGNEGTLIIKTQVPNYLPLLYVLLYPYALLPAWLANASWAMTNIAFAFSSCYLLCKSFQLPSRAGWTAIVLLSLSAPFASTMKQGQQSLLVLFFFSLGVYCLRASNTWSSSGRLLSGISFGIGFVKYSFAPAFAVPILLGRRPTVFAYSMAAQAVGILLFSWRTGSSFQASILGPLRIAKQEVTKVMIGQGDLMSLLSCFQASLQSHNALLIAIPALLLAVTVPALALRRNMDELAFWSLISLCSLAFLRHLYYDYVFLLIPLLFLLSARAGTYTRIALIVNIAWFWYVAQPLRVVLDHLGWVYDVQNLLIGLGLLLNLASIVILAAESSPSQGCQPTSARSALSDAVAGS